MLMAVYSSFKNRHCRRISSVSARLASPARLTCSTRAGRLREAAKLGFHRAIIPAANRPRQAIDKMES